MQKMNSLASGTAEALNQKEHHSNHSQKVAEYVRLEFLTMTSDPEVQTRRLSLC